MEKSKKIEEIIEDVCPTASGDEKDLMRIWARSDLYSVKLSHYFSIYSELLGKFRGQKCTLVEVGVLNGGGLVGWKDYLGEKAEIIGIDLNPNIKKFEKEGFRTFVGDQADINFWNSFYDEVGKVDILIDDGGHSSHQQISTLISALMHIKNEAILVFEDTQYGFFEFVRNIEGENNFANYSKLATDNLTLRQKQHSPRPERFGKISNPSSLELFKNVRSVSFFNGMIVYRLEPDKKRKESLVIANNPKKESFDDYRIKTKIHGIKVPWPDPMSVTTKIVKSKYTNEDGNTQNIQTIKLK